MRACNILRYLLHGIRKPVSVCWAITASCFSSPVHYNICQFWGRGMQTAVQLKSVVPVHRLHAWGGISLVMRLTLWASSDRREHGGGWEWSLIQSKTKKWHKNEINKNTVASLTPCGERQQSRTCFHFLLALTATMFFWRTRHVYSTCCSLVRSSARGPFAL